MRRKIIHKTVKNSLSYDFSNTDWKNDLKIPNFPQAWKIRPQSSCFNSCKNTGNPTDSPNSLYENQTKSFFNSPRRMSLTFADKSQAIKEIKGDKVKNFQNYEKKRIKSTQASGNVQEKLISVNSKPVKNLNLLVKGRPLTANPGSKDHTLKDQLRSVNRKKESLCSYGESDFMTPVDPKFYDEEYTNLDEYTQMLLNQPVQPVNQTSPEYSVLMEKKYEEGSERPKPIITSAPFKKTSETTVVNNIGLIVTMRLGDMITTPFKLKSKGKLLKGRWSKSGVSRPIKTVQNIKIS
ncbi:hypothetical protein SteCoe_36593 [Stentor coeruleus]|uniref:Uncharacterized protein n=1 Tax=Stentor coeruleus TaxID=5963 RepID=A0A1R2APS9_9CILI|nr:hypothetical protein SteCoe_36593 [Stentor coeruleus]